MSDMASDMYELIENEVVGCQACGAAVWHMRKHDVVCQRIKQWRMDHNDAQDPRVGQIREM